MTIERRLDHATLKSAVAQSGAAGGFVWGTAGLVTRNTIQRDAAEYQGSRYGRMGSAVE